MNIKYIICLFTIILNESCWLVAFNWRALHIEVCSSFHERIKSICSLFILWRFCITVKSLIFIAGYMAHVLRWSKTWKVKFKPFSRPTLFEKIRKFFFLKGGMVLMLILLMQKLIPLVTKHFTRSYSNLYLIRNKLYYLVKLYHKLCVSWTQFR